MSKEMGLVVDDIAGRELEWAKLQTTGIGHTLDKEQHRLLTEYLYRQAIGGEMWGPNYWCVSGWSRPQTTGRLSNKLRVKLVDQYNPKVVRVIVWWQTIKWKRLKTK